MQEDFHFTVVYMACRCAGFGPPESRTVAGASQFTDDCTFMGPVGRTGGGRYRPVITCPQGALALDPGAQASILRPFHFAGGEERDAVVLPGNATVTATAARAAVLAASSAPYGLHALGIALHALADSFSHQGFSPFVSPLNEVRQLALIPPDEGLALAIQGFFLQKWAARLLSLGHAEAGFCPDVPFLRWKYRHPGPSAWSRAAHEGVEFGDGWVVRDNARITAAAVGAVAAALARVPGLSPPRSAGEVAAWFSPARIRRQNDLKGRARQWSDLYRRDRFFDFRTGEDAVLGAYDGKEWLGRAYGRAARLRPDALPAFRRGYRQTDWWKFQQAARWHITQVRSKKDEG